jgi:hypothetical protein
LDKLAECRYNFWGTLKSLNLNKKNFRNHFNKFYLTFNLHKTNKSNKSKLSKRQKLKNSNIASQKSNRRVWQILKNVCETDSLTAEQLLSSANLVALDGCLKCVVDPYTGIVYNIPNYCITDPVYKKQFNKEILQKAEIILHLDLLYVFNNVIHPVKVSNKITGLELKALFCKLENIDINKHKIRLLAKGQELKNDVQLCLFNIVEGDKIQVSCMKIEEIEL